MRSKPTSAMIHKHDTTKAPYGMLLPFILLLNTDQVTASQFTSTSYENMDSSFLTDRS